jgi:CRP-like cAMP-binding protein
MNRNSADALRSIEVFRSLDQSAFLELSRQCLIREFGASELVIGQSDENFDVLFLMSGQVRISLYSQDGQRVGFRDLRPGSVFGELSAIDGSPRSVSVEATEPSTIAIMKRQSFLQACEKHPEFAMALLRHLTQMVRTLTTRIFEFSTLAVRNRIRLELARLADGHADEGILNPPPAHAEIAARVSTHREAVSRELAWLERHGYVVKEAKALRIPSLRKLRALVEEDWH